MSPNHDGATFQVESRVWVPTHPEVTFEFFGDARNLNLMTPKWFLFRHLTRLPVAMERGTRIDYLLLWRGLPLRWQSEVTAWEPNRAFTYRQARGPYRHFIHEHLFESHDGGTLMTDRVRYTPPASFFSKALVERDLERIFDYRKRKARRIFGGDEAPAEAETGETAS